MVEWRLIYEHDFRDGPAPNGSGWGNIQFTSEGLRLSPDGEYCGLYFFPTECPNEFMIETTAKFVESTDTAEIQLLIRESSEINCESGMTLYQSNQGSVRHMINKTDYLRETFPLDFNVELDRWYNLRFAFYEGKVEAFIDGKKYFERNGGYPKCPSIYREPHVAAFNGTVIFQSVKIYEPYVPEQPKPVGLAEVAVSVASILLAGAAIKAWVVPRLKRLIEEMRRTI